MIQQLTDRQKEESWRAKYTGAYPMYSEHEMNQINRFWRSLGRKIASRARIRDKALVSGKPRS